ncbi:hypothetical protein LIA77_10614 [Sarocladium implicatum]|nr:hypothetical protein LIA77_10614 [Sarocladium implicatum]
MYVLGRGFSHRRKSASKSPRDLHIRKISLSGCSVGSWDSEASSTCSSSVTPTMPTFPAAFARTESAITTRSSFENNPLGLHPSYIAPPRLAHRPYLQPEQRRAYTAPEVGSSNMGSTFFYDDTEDDDEGVSFGFAENDAETMELPLHEEQPKNMALPPAASPLDYTSHEREQPQDYFMVQLTQRPPMPRSHWSESTIQTLRSFDDLDDLDSGVCTPANEIDLTEVDLPTDDLTDDFISDMTDDESPGTVVGVAEPVVILPNFSYKRPVAPSRPSVQTTVDKVEEVAKTGGWKRRGVVFNKEEAGDSSSDEEERI